MPDHTWGTGLEGRRLADLGDGTFRNPVLAGDFPDPTVLKDGADYYLTTSSFDASPGLLIHHSRDLVNWTPLTFALPRPLTTVFAVDLVKHGGRCFIYIPFIPSPWAPEFGPAPRTQALPSRELVLPGQRGRRHGRAADRSHGHRGSVAVGTRSVGEQPGEPGRAHA